MPGAELCTSYRFVDERPGRWAAEARRINAELAVHGKKPVSAVAVCAVEQ